MNKDPKALKENEEMTVPKDPPAHRDSKDPKVGGDYDGLYILILI